MDSGVSEVEVAGRIGSNSYSGSSVVFNREKNLGHIKGFTVTNATWGWGKHGKICNECMGKIVILILDNLRKVDILQFL